MSAHQVLARTVAQVGGQPRPSQQQMCDTVADVLDTPAPLLVEAPPGTGKTFAYLSAVADHITNGGGPVVIATANKALQRQLVDHDLPAVAAATDGELCYTLVKGRGNYLCQARLADLDEGGTVSPRVDLASLRQLRSWAKDTVSGDRDDTPVAVDDPTWSAVAVGPSECPGGDQCPFADSCFSEQARAAGAGADVIVTNTTLYLLHLLTDGKILPDHDAVIFDEAHTVEQTASEVFGAELFPGRFAALAARTATTAGERQLADRLRGCGERLEAFLDLFPDRQIGPDTDTLTAMLAEMAATLRDVRATVEEVRGESEQERSQLQRLKRATEQVWQDVAALQVPGDDEAIVTSGRAPRKLRLAPLDVGRILSDLLFPQVDTVVFTSATLTFAGGFDHPADTLGVSRDGRAWRSLQVPSPFDHARQGLLYVPKELPPPSGKPEEEDRWREAFRERAAELVDAAGGRALMLFTSWPHLQAAAAWFADHLHYPVLVQGQLPRGELVERFLTEPETVLCATRSFWQGMDAPGPACNLVIIDRIPFPHRNDPLVAARRSRVSGNPFAAVDLPEAALLLAQGAGRLIRTVSDRGVVAVLDSRLANASYRQALLATMPPLRRVIDLGEVCELLGELDAAAMSAAAAA